MASFLQPAGSLRSNGRAVAYFQRKRRRGRADLTDFSALIAAPEDLGPVIANGDSTAVVLPANARLAFSHSEALDADDASLVVTSRSYPSPALAANEVHRLDLGEEGREVVVHRGAAAPAGTFTVYIVDAFGRHLPIATATFS